MRTNERATGHQRNGGHYLALASRSAHQLMRRARRRVRSAGVTVDPAESTFFLGRETLYAADRPGVAIWREPVFNTLSRNASRATAYFKQPRSRVCERSTRR